MKLITALPDDLLLEVVSYVMMTTKVEFAKINRELALRLMKKMSGRDTITVSFLRVQILVGKRQETRFTRKNPPLQPILQEFCQSENPPKFLKILASDFKDLPVIPSFESIELDSCNMMKAENLHISAFSNLRAVSLISCRFITNVSCLKNVHTLKLDRCDGIQDISSLNHNYEISILHCAGITNSKSFEHSTIIHIGIGRLFSFLVPLSPKKLLKVKNLRLVGIFSLPTVGSDTLDLPPSLESLQLEGIISPFSLPTKHQLQTLIVRKCPGLSSCLNMGNIRYVTLQDLVIDTLDGLEGLGNYNRDIELIDLNIRDFSPFYNLVEIF